MTDALDMLPETVRTALNSRPEVHVEAIAVLRAELLRLARENAELREQTKAPAVVWKQRAERGEADVAAHLAAFKELSEKYLASEAELAQSRETIKRLNRRVQIAESGLAEKIKASGRSLGRALANAAADMFMHERDEARAELAQIKERIAKSNPVLCEVPEHAPEDDPDYGLFYMPRELWNERVLLVRYQDGDLRVKLEDGE